MHAYTDEEEQTVREGEAAALLLNDAAFLLAIERVRAKCSEGILTSPPEADKKRDDLYRMSRALTEVTTELLDMVTAAELVNLQADLAEQAVDPEEFLLDPTGNTHEY